MIEVKKRLAEKIYEILKETYPIDPSKIDFSYTPNIKMGDLALAFPFQLAKEMKKAPRDIASEIAPKLESLEGITKVEVAGAEVYDAFVNDRHLQDAPARFDLPHPVKLPSLPYLEFLHLEREFLERKYLVFHNCLESYPYQDLHLKINHLLVNC